MKKGLKQLGGMISYLFSKLLNSNPELNTAIAIKKGKVRLEKFFDTLAAMDQKIKEKKIRIDELKTLISVKWENALKASLLTKNKIDVTIALTNKKACDSELVVLESELTKDIDLTSKLKLQFATAKAKIEAEERKVTSLKARKEGLKIQKDLLGTGKDLMFPDSESNVFKLDDLEREVNAMEGKIESENNLASEFLGEDVTNIGMSDIGAEVDALMAAAE
jgi:phage shock protein A